MNNFKTLNTDTHVILFHGTTLDAWNQIKRLGFASENGTTCWNCSDDRFTYFYEYEKFCDCEGFELDDENSYETIIRRANEQAQIQNAFLDMPDSYTRVIEIRIPKIFVEDFIETDDSCENMQHCGAVQIMSEDLNKLLQYPDVEVYAYDFEFCVKCSLLYISGISENRYAIKGLEQLPSYERSVLQALRSTFNETFYDECISWPDIVQTYTFK